MNFHRKTSYQQKYIGITLLFLLLLLCNCSTKKDAFFNRAYHSTTAHFNVIFNGSESYKEGFENIKNTPNDNYTSVLPVYFRPTKTDALKQAPQWDKTIEKCSKAIKKHSMMIKGVQKCKPIDKAYLLLGQAYYQRQDYADALGVFNHLIFNHSKTNTYLDAYTWKAQTLIQLDRLQEAEENLEEVRALMADNKEQYKQHWEAVFSDLLIAQKDYEQASIYLTELVKHRHLNRDFKTRIYFILGQVQQKLEQMPAASQNFQTTLKRNPVYEMEFNATINLATCSDDIDVSRNKLKKLFKDGRNETYKDQIFYTLALIDLKEDDTVAAINNLESSIFWSVNNKHQKTVSALTLAEIYFSQTKYPQALTHYDTVLASLSPTFPQYNTLKKRTEILKDLVSNLMQVAHEDSMQYLASLSESDRDIYINKLIEQYKEDEQQRLNDNAEKLKMIESAKNKRQNSSSATRNGKMVWIFADATQTKLGIQKFQKQWGVRTLEDFWFVNDIQLMNDFANNQPFEETNNTKGNDTLSSTADKNTANRSSNPTTKAFYLQDMPTTPEAMAKSNETIANAIYNAGTIYENDLNDKNLAINQWEDLLKRYPDHKLASPTCFQLYKTFAALNNTNKSEYYKQLILSKYGQTDYARIIQDPNYYQKIAEQQQQAERFYTMVYDTFAHQHYWSAYQLAEQGCNEWSDINITSKLAYIKAISAGKLYGNDSLRVLLQTIPIKYPTTSIDTAATELLAALDRLEKPVSQTNTPNIEEKTIVVEPFTYNEKTFHFVIAVVNIKDTKITPLKNNIADFNKTFFGLQNLELSNFYINNAEQMITISKFKDKNAAMDYYKLFISDTKYLSTLNSTPSAKVYVISDANYVTFYKNKQQRATYDEFFKTNYLQQ